MARQKRPWLAALLSLILPGLGELYIGESRKGAYLIALTPFYYVVVPWFWFDVISGVWRTSAWAVPFVAALVGYATIDSYLGAKRANRFGGLPPEKPRRVEAADRPLAVAPRQQVRLR